jgi:HK97 gp10 family phage protein
VAERFQVSGLRQLGEAMRGLRADVAGKVARQATAAGASVARKAVKARAPRDSGNLQAAIVMKRVRGSSLTEEYVVAVRKGKTRDAKAGKRGEGKLGKDAFYAAFQEFGTVKAPAQPFIRPGFEESVEAATQAIAKRLKQRIEKVSAK